MLAPNTATYSRHLPGLRKPDSVQLRGRVVVRSMKARLALVSFSAIQSLSFERVYGVQFHVEKRLSEGAVRTNIWARIRAVQKMNKCIDFDRSPAYFRGSDFGICPRVPSPSFPEYHGIQDAKSMRPVSFIEHPALFAFRVRDSHT